jgi:hypothetical protein
MAEVDIDLYSVQPLHNDKRLSNLFIICRTSITHQPLSAPTLAATFVSYVVAFVCYLYQQEHQHQQRHPHLDSIILLTKNTLCPSASTFHGRFPQPTPRQAALQALFDSR